MGHLGIAAGTPFRCVPFDAKALANGVAGAAFMRLIAVQWNVELVRIALRLHAGCVCQPILHLHIEGLGIDSIHPRCQRL